MRQKINFKHSDESIKKVLSHLYPYDLAQMYQKFDLDEKKRLLHLINLDVLVEVFVELDEEDQLEIIDLIQPNTKKSLLRKLETDELKAFIELYDDEEKRHELVSLLSKVKAKTIQLLLTYDEDEAASIMMTDFFTIPIGLTIKEATNMIITKSKDNDYIDTVFIVDDDKKCIGLVDLRDLIIARPNQLLSNMLIDDFPYVNANDPIEEAIQIVLDYDRNVIPVFDESHSIIGIITADDIFDELIEDYEEDYDSFSQISDHDVTLTPFERSKQRLPWLFIGVFLNLLTITILSNFSATIEQVTVLVLFQPMILGMAGNMGTQSLAVTILGIHQKDYKEPHHAKKHVLKEMTIGLINSLLLGAVAFAFVSIYLSILNISSQNPVEVAFAVFMALSIAMFVSSFLGSIVPITFDKLGIDPASASGPMMTTINDIISLVIYFSIATLMFITVI